MGECNRRGPIFLRRFVSSLRTLRLAEERPLHHPHKAGSRGGLQPCGSVGHRRSLFPGPVEEVGRDALQLNVTRPLSSVHQGATSSPCRP